MDANYTRKMAALQKDHWWYEGRRRIIGAMLDTFKLDKAQTTILEAGCGPGANLTTLSFFGSVKAFEPDEFSSHHAADISGLTVKTGALPSPIPFDEQFDLVCAFDVIEHIEDDLAALQALREKTKPQGHALFTVPAHMWLWSAHDEINHHKRRYNLAQFKDVLEKAGFTVEKISYYNMWLFPLAAGVRLLKNALKIKDQGDISMPSLLLNKVFYMIFSSEQKQLQRGTLPFGLSIIAHCTNNPPSPL